MSIKNIKASFILEDKVNTSGIFKQNNVVYTIYPHVKTLVNVTGIKSFEQLEISKKILESKLKQKVVNVRIDNTFFSKKNYKNVDMVKVYKFMQNNSLFHVDYNIELFAGMYLKPKTSVYPTILFFRTGSYTIMGAKKKDILIECQTFVNKLIIMFNKHCI